MCNQARLATATPTCLIGSWHWYIHRYIYNAQRCHESEAIGPAVWGEQTYGIVKRIRWIVLHRPPSTTYRWSAERVHPGTSAMSWNPGHRDSPLADVDAAFYCFYFSFLFCLCRALEAFWLTYVTLILTFIIIIIIIIIIIYFNKYWT